MIVLGGDGGFRKTQPTLRSGTTAIERCVMKRPYAICVCLCGALVILVACGDTAGPTDSVSASSTPQPRRSNDPMTTIEEFIADQTIDRSEDDWRTRVPRPPKVAFDEARKYYWDLHTNKGLIRIQLMPEVAPMHVSSTSYLTLLGYYDGLAFHRVIPGFMAQGGCPVGNGTGGPAYSYDGEFDRDVRHDRGGLLSMANRGADTDGSQFFITFVETPHLDDKHTIFGEVVDGMDAVRELESCGTESGKPTTKLFIEKAEIVVE